MEIYIDTSSLLIHLTRVCKVSNQDCTRLIQLFEPLEVERNEDLFRLGEIARYVYFIYKGCLITRSIFFKEIGEIVNKGGPPNQEKIRVGDGKTWTYCRNPQL